ncbi:class I SAM-dependent methyltransferase, partial [Halorubrum sp. SP3]
NYVDDETPLYYRDWGEVFTSLGLIEVDVVRGDRDTARTFRVTD